MSVIMESSGSALNAAVQFIQYGGNKSPHIKRSFLFLSIQLAISSKK